MRAWYCLLFLAAAQPASAASEPPYYGPMKAWHGIGYKFGFKHDIEKDGTWRVVASTRGGEPVDMALYRAAELAREQGFAYVELLGGRESRSPGISSATIYARPSRSPAAPSACRSDRRGTCYTADVTELLRVLGGPGGAQPGVAIVDHYDSYGRAITLSGFGTGMASRTPPRPAVPAPMLGPVAPVPLAAKGIATSPARAPASRYERALKAVQPVRGREPNQGWTISD